MLNPKSRAGVLLLVAAAVIALLTMPVHRLWGVGMLFLVALVAGGVCLAAGFSEDRRADRERADGLTSGCEGLSADAYGDPDEVPVIPI